VEPYRTLVCGVKNFAEIGWTAKPRKPTDFNFNVQADRHFTFGQSGVLGFSQLTIAGVSASAARTQHARQSQSRLCQPALVPSLCAYIRNHHKCLN